MIKRIIEAFKLKIWQETDLTLSFLRDISRIGEVCFTWYEEDAIFFDNYGLKGYWASSSKRYFYQMIIRYACGQNDIYVPDSLNWDLVHKSLFLEDAEGFIGKCNLRRGKTYYIRSR